MRHGAVVALEVVLDPDLPVRCLRPLEPLPEAEPVDVDAALGQVLGQARRGPRPAVRHPGSGFTKTNGPQTSTATGQERVLRRSRTPARARSAEPPGGSRRARRSTRGRDTEASSAVPRPARRGGRGAGRRSRTRADLLAVPDDDDRDMTGLGSDEGARLGELLQCARRTARCARRSARAPADGSRGLSRTRTPGASGPHRGLRRLRAEARLLPSHPPPATLD